MTNLRLQYVNEYLDRHGKRRRYFRRGSKRGVLPGEVGSPAFMAAYQALLGDSPVTPSTTKIEGSLGLLITEFYGSRPFRNLKQSSQRTYRAALEPLARAHGHRTARITHKHATKLIADIGDKKPAMANLTKKVLQTVFKYAVKADWVESNPIIGIDSFKIGEYHTWSEGELQTFEKRWPVGTRQRLAYALLLYSTQRVGDVVKMHRSDLVAGELHVIQQKTGAELYLPFVQEMQQALVAIPATGLTLLTREDGRQMTRAGLTALMRRAVAEAGLPARCVPHGLRKAGIRRMAEAGRSVNQIAAVSGHKSLREVQRYTAAADQRKLARDALGNKKGSAD
jgi:enterobacteria phage integrase